MSLNQQLKTGAPGIVAILRGITPDEVVSIGTALVAAGITIIEVPLNSPQPLLSIERLQKQLPDAVLIGAGTVTSVDAVEKVAATGARLIVAPNANTEVIKRAVALNLEVIPGVMTPTEAFAAYDAGARHLKLFPAASSGIAHLKALREVLPGESRVWAVGGAGANNLGEWLAAGAVGIGVGGSLYKPGVSVQSVQTRADELVAAWRIAVAAR
jgi:2-dehydro-3-deoxyphosphogalactonate aldolase